MIDLETDCQIGGAVKAPQVRTVDEILHVFQTDRSQGLLDLEAERRREKYGPNELITVPPPPLWRKFIRQFDSVVIWLLIFAALISGGLGEWIDSAAIFAIVILNAILSFLQEEKAERALAALRNLSAPSARVLRNGHLSTIAARDLVVGDVIALDQGDNIPADARLIAASALRTQEAALTGESTPVDKDSDLLLPEGATLAERRNMVYMGTSVGCGNARAVVVATAMETELGRIAGLLRTYQPEPTPLQKQLTSLGRALAAICLLLVSVIFTLELWRGDPLMEAFLLSVSLAVAAVPEGLPAVVTIALALGLQRMVKRNALIRRLPSVETLGAVTVICSDKTGTLTRNEMTVREIDTGDKHFLLTGSGYVPHGEIQRTKGPDAGSNVEPAKESGLVLLLDIARHCNHAQVTGGGDRRSWHVVGDPTEGALLIAALKAGLEETARKHVLYELPFDSERKLMSVIVATEGDSQPTMCTKGAPEVVLDRSRAEWQNGQIVPLTAARRRQILEISSEMASRSLRVLAFGFRDCTDVGETHVHESDLVFVGLAGLIDPPRGEAKAAVSTCRAAGIRPVMITGDHPATAQAIALELGIATNDDRVVTGIELDRMSESDLANAVRRIAVYARVSAAHKLRVVRAWKSHGEVVAMTGDGVNDAPAIKAADIGIAMGLTGTDVTRESSAMVLLDDNFASIVTAVEEGRAIYDNILKSLTYLLSCNTGELLLMLVATLIGWPAPLLPVQLLWINLITDGLPALALGLEPPEPNLMLRKPRASHESILSASLGGVVILQGLLLAAVGITAFGFVYMAHPEDEPRARTMTFGVLVFAELLRASAARSRTMTFLELGPLTNPYLFAALALSGVLQLCTIAFPPARTIFDTVPYTMNEWAVLGFLSLIPVTIIEVTKLIRRRLSNRVSSRNNPAPAG